MAFRRWLYDSEGNRGTVINFSELEAPDNIDNPSADYILDKIIFKLPDIGFGETNRYNEESQQATVDALRMAFTLLTSKQRAVIYKKFYQNKNGREMAEELGICPVAVHRLLKRALKDLRMLLTENTEQKRKIEKSGKMQDIDGILFALKKSIYTSSYISTKNKQIVYELVDKIDGIVIHHQRKKKNG